MAIFRRRIDLNIRAVSHTKIGLKNSRLLPILLKIRGRVALIGRSLSGASTIRRRTAVTADLIKITKANTI